MGLERVMEKQPHHHAYTRPAQGAKKPEGAPHAMRFDRRSGSFLGAWFKRVSEDEIELTAEQHDGAYLATRTRKDNPILHEHFQFGGRAMEIFEGPIT